MIMFEKYFLLVMIGIPGSGFHGSYYERIQKLGGFNTIDECFSASFQHVANSRFPVICVPSMRMTIKLPSLNPSSAAGGRMVRGNSFHKNKDILEAVDDPNIKIWHYRFKICR